MREESRRSVREEQVEPLRADTRSKTKPKTFFFFLHREGAICVLVPVNKWNKTASAFLLASSCRSKTAVCPKVKPGQTVVDKVRCASRHLLFFFFFQNSSPLLDHALSARHRGEAKTQNQIQTPVDAGSRRPYIVASNQIAMRR